MIATSFARRPSIGSTHPGSVSLSNGTSVGSPTKLRRPQYPHPRTYADSIRDSAQRAGVKTLSDLPAHVEPFIHRGWGIVESSIRRCNVWPQCEPPWSYRTDSSPHVPQSYDSKTGVSDAFAGTSLASLSSWAGNEDS